MVDASIDIIDRGTISVDENFLIEASTAATASDPNPDLEMIDIPVYNLVVDHPEGVILWDTGIHPDARDGHWPSGLVNAFPPANPRDHRLDDDLATAGYDVDDIDYVVQSHLHMDHAGGLELFDGSETPIFVHERELKYAYYSAKTGEGSAGYVLEDFDHDLNWQILHLERETHLDGIEFVHLPGHTPGLFGMFIDLDGHPPLLFTSDMVDNRVNYEKEIPMGPGLIWNRETWFESLRRIKDLQRTTDAEVVFGHDPEQFERIEDGWQ